MQALSFRVCTVSNLQTVKQFAGTKKCKAGRVAWIKVEVLWLSTLIPREDAIKAKTFENTRTHGENLPDQKIAASISMSAMTQEYDYEHGLVLPFPSHLAILWHGLHHLKGTGCAGFCLHYTDVVRVSWVKRCIVIPEICTSLSRLAHYQALVGSGLAGWHAYQPGPHLAGRPFLPYSQVRMGASCVGRPCLTHCQDLIILWVLG